MQNLSSVSGKSKEDRADGNVLFKDYARDLPTGFCKLCDADFYINFEYNKMGLCGHCARKAGGAYVKAHTGRYDPHLDPELADAERKQLAKERNPYKKVVIPQWLRTEVFERDGYACKHCGVRKHLRADHILPESKGGPTTLDNLQTLCRSCNSRKGGRVCPSP
jgi:hypothetical protein